MMVNARFLMRPHVESVPRVRKAFGSLERRGECLIGGLSLGSLTPAETDLGYRSGEEALEAVVRADTYTASP